MESIDLSCIEFIFIYPIFLIGAFIIGAVQGFMTKTKGVNRAIKSFWKSFVIAVVLSMICLILLEQCSNKDLPLFSSITRSNFLKAMSLLPLPFSLLLYAGVYTGLFCQYIHKRMRGTIHATKGGRG